MLEEGASVVYTSKEQIRVMIATTVYRIEGQMHVIEGSRLTDALNSKSKDFFAVTDATVFALSGDQPLWNAGYVAVNRESIALIVPLDDA